MSDGRDKPAYVGFMRVCGCAIAACVDDTDHPQAARDFLSEMGKDEHVYIERKTVGWVRDNLRFCEERDGCSQSTKSQP